MTQHNAADSSERGRITARVSADKQRVLQLAADLSGSTLNQFIVQAAVAAAEKVFEQEEAFRTIQLNAEESERFLALLDAPPKANDALKRAKAKFRKQYLEPHSTT
ncbi:DUF1778 domain-containing protein [Paraburkholderia sp. A1RO-5L]|uniref:type II toxin-antitoxin system TacA family antitoxin n=1 Tax=unclassified Paraburkholderia TaxID=2615204 RepID=UPI003B801FFC